METPFWVFLAVMLLGVITCPQHHHHNLSDWALNPSAGDHITGAGLFLACVKGVAHLLIKK